jgi:transposase-like protein
MVVRDACPGCGATQFKKNGHIHSGKQNHRCKACGRPFVASAEERIIADEQRTLIEHLLHERISLRGICRAVGVSLTWLSHLMVERFAACPDHLHVQLSVRPTAVVIRQLEAEADEMWSFVQISAVFRSLSPHGSRSGHGHVGWGWQADSQTDPSTPSVLTWREQRVLYQACV